MAVNGFRPDAEPPPREDGWENDDRRASLVERARAAKEAATEVRRRSQELRLLLEEWRAGGPVSRCVRCRRYRLGDRWLDTRTTPPLPLRASPVAHALCDDCAEVLDEVALVGD